MWKKIPVQCSRSLPTEGRTRGNALSHQREERTKPHYLPSIHPFLSAPSQPTKDRRTPSFRSKRTTLHRGLHTQSEQSVPSTFPCTGIGPRRSLPAPPESGSEHRLEPSLCATDLSSDSSPSIPSTKAMSTLGKPFGKPPRPFAENPSDTLPHRPSADLPKCARMCIRKPIRQAFRSSSPLQADRSASSGPVTSTTLRP